MKDSSIGERVKALRTQKGLTQKGFGELINISYGHLSNIEKGKDYPSDRIIELICYKFHISEDWLRYGEGSLETQPIYTKVSRLTEKEKNTLQKIFNVKEFNDNHLYLTKIIIEMMGKTNIQEDSNLYYIESLKKLLIGIEQYLKIASESAEYGFAEISPYKSLHEVLEKAIIENLKDTASSFFVNDLNSHVHTE